MIWDVWWAFTLARANNLHHAGQLQLRHNFAHTFVREEKEFFLHFRFYGIVIFPFIWPCSFRFKIKSPMLVQYDNTEIC